MMGIHYKPIMPRFKDMSGLQPWGKPDAAMELWGGEEKVVGFVVEQIRRFKPDVIVSLAANGFNGNPQHAAASLSAVLASRVSGDSSQYASQLNRLEAWEPKKVYLHVAEQEKAASQYDVLHTHDWELECGGRPGNARILAARGNVLHESQEMKEECDATSNFALIQTAVGPDRINQDNLFENIE
jgi:LmbE family N-acetylglucosaminyl deacetylase